MQLAFALSPARMRKITFDYGFQRIIPQDRDFPKMA
jgi:hypothetical protein